MTRTVFVNPAARKSARKRRSAPNRAASIVVHRAPAAPARKRRRNSGITPFVASANPIVVRRTKRRARQNPMNITVKKTLANSLASLGGAALAVGVDAVGLSKIKHTWGRNGARAALAVASAAVVPGNLGVAVSSAALVPLMQELAAHFLGEKRASAVSQEEGVVTTEADLDLLSQDLGALLEPDELTSW